MSAKILHKCPACGGVLTKRHYDTCPRVDRERKKRDAKVLAETLKRFYRGHA